MRYSLIVGLILLLAFFYLREVRERDLMYWNYIELHNCVYESRPTGSTGRSKFGQIMKCDNGDYPYRPSLFRR